MNLTQLIAQNKKLSFTMTSYASILAIFLNLATVHSPIIGIAASIIYLLVNSTFIGQAFFQDENLFTKFLLGSLLLIVMLGLIGWMVLMLYNLDNTRTTIVLLVTATLASILNHKMKTRNVVE